ncbi:dihydrolipoyllysine-residue acetyltransferase [Legionella spiritensis]|uniref:Acetyltransferase component of pyruvate dehydrogenase complex n=1 Tax=Legionella spiritensis TaxID=452 RepID=A0A0W0YXM7_LEGSP|nr:dihydrolipoyllysine-residue acetyltransferase [Legionella spiritensis]KTD61669.1 pyruvate dehydrogenase E2 component [Legionella spiritensis]SNV39031.1 pyruvate dehydrogenase E2 component [Legionella spiritensis]
MAEDMKVTIPDIGGATDVDVIEILIKPGDEISVDTPLVTLESEKASMDIPSPSAGKVEKVLVKVGDKVSEGDEILILSGSQPTAASEDGEMSKSSTPPQKEQTPPGKPESPQPKSVSSSESREILIPDIGGAENVDVIEVMVNAGDVIAKDQSLITLEGDKATMEIPSPYSGEVLSVAVKVGDKVSQGNRIVTMKVEQEEPEKTKSPSGEPESIADKTMVEEKAPQRQEKAGYQPRESDDPASTSTNLVAAGPAVRRLARELGVALDRVKGSGRKNRITREDVQAYVKERLSQKAGSGLMAMPQAPVVDFSKFGEIETKPLNKIKRLTGVNVHRSWITIPHVTQFDEADITELEAFRKQESDKAKQAGYKLTLLAFVTKAVTKALTKFPQFNASLDAGGENLIYKKYFNIGIAVDTPNGLVVPVIKNTDQLSIGDIARQMGELSGKAREKGLTPADMSGGCFTISSLGGIGGTAFTPIVNGPEVAILGLSRSSIKPVYQGSDFKPRLMLPLSLSYDHRVIDGAEAARFTRFLADLLEDARRILL